MLSFVAGSGRGVNAKRVSAFERPDGRVPSRARRGRPKVHSDAAQRAVIVDTARALFVANGYGGTTMDDVAAACRVSKRTLYRLFPGKTELFAAIVEAHRPRMLALPGDYDHLPLDEALAQILRVDIDPVADLERMALIRLIMVETVRFPELEAIMWSHGADRSREALAEWLGRQHSLGRIGFDDAETAARILMDMIFGPLTRRTRGVSEWGDDAERRAYQRECIRVFLDGVRPR